MPWKVFTQSLALTNFGNKLANDQFIQRQKCLLLPKYSPKVGQFGLWTILLPSGDPFRGHTRKVGACWSKHTLRWLAKYALSLCGIWSCLTGIAVWTSAVVLSVTCKVCSSVMSKSNREGFPYMPLAMNSMPLSSANLRFSLLWYAPSV